MQVLGGGAMERGVGQLASGNLLCEDADCDLLCGVMRLPWSTHGDAREWSLRVGKVILIPKARVYVSLHVRSVRSVRAQCIPCAMYDV